MLLTRITGEGRSEFHSNKNLEGSGATKRGEQWVGEGGEIGAT